MSEKIYLWQGQAPYSEFSADQAQPSLTPYPAAGSPGAVIVLAGGAYKRKTAYEAYPVAEKLAGFGVSAFVLDYRIYPCHKYAPLADCSRAVRLLHHMGYQKVAVLGFSAGGNLACTAATHYDAGDPDAEDPVERCSSRPDGFIPCYAVSSFISYTHTGTVRYLLGSESESLPDLRFFSSELNVTPDTPPAFLWHTFADAAVPVESCLNLGRALASSGVPFEMHIFPEGGHGLGLAESVPSVAKWIEYLKLWLKRGGYLEET